MEMPKPVKQHYNNIIAEYVDEEKGRFAVTKVETAPTKNLVIVHTRTKTVPEPGAINFSFSRDRWGLIDGVWHLLQ